MPDETMRAEFERWYEHDFMGGLDSAGEFDAERNCYVVFQVHMAWKGWQASRASAAPGEKPFGYWHQGDNMDESDFFLAAEFGNVGCKHCVPLYAGQPPSDAGQRAECEWQLTDDMCQTYESACGQAWQFNDIAKLLDEAATEIERLGGKGESNA